MQDLVITTPFKDFLKETSAVQVVINTFNFPNSCSLQLCQENNYRADLISAGKEQTSEELKPKGKVYQNVRFITTSDTNSAIHNNNCSQTIWKEPEYQQI